MTATASAAAAAVEAAEIAEGTPDFGFFELEVLRTRRLGHSFLRITFGGASLAGFRSGGYDQSLSLFLPPADREHTVLPSTAEDTWFTQWRAMPDEERPVMRSYTVREQRRTPEGVDEVDIDFVLHGDTSAASYWAGRAVTGRRIMAIGPMVAENKSVRFQPPHGHRRDPDVRRRDRPAAWPPRSWTGSRTAPGSRPGSRCRTRTTGWSCRRSPTPTSPGSSARAARAASAPTTCWRWSGRPEYRPPKPRTPGSRASPRRSGRSAALRAGARRRPARGALHRLLAARRERGGAPRGGVRGPGAQRGPGRGPLVRSRH